MEIDKATVDYVAHLARLDLQEKEVAKLASQLKEILDFIDKLAELATADVAPTSHILALSNVSREDSPQDSLSPEKVLSNAPQKEGNFFVVPKIIE
jgi:aspartyl-tRNA(Asn)/glutamyl-tRNA(Gln) amidotransferase subunit C